MDDIVMGECQITALELANDEFDKLIYQWNATEYDYPQEKTIITLFEDQANRSPERIALVFDGESISYGQLNTRANQLSRSIRENFFSIKNARMPVETLIALYLDRGIEMIVSILAVFKAGGAYVPISPEIPSARFQYIVEDTNTPIILSQSHYVDRINQQLLNSNSRPLVMDVCHRNNQECDIDCQQFEKSKPDNLAYVIYTSGTTGLPKGVMMEHASVVNRVIYMIKSSRITQEDKYLFKINYAFDASVADIFTHLCVGACLYIVKNIIDLDEIASVLKKHGCTSLHLVPSQFDILKEVLINSSLKKLYLSGEKLPQQIFKSFDSMPVLFNYYGPTEAGDISCYLPIDVNDISNIGKCFYNTHFYVLSDILRPVGVGEVGELYISGVCLARGYLNKPELTREKFIDNPYQTSAEKNNNLYAKMYKTGDRVRWLDNGNIEYLGRNDSQLKIRGMRVEIGEIEIAIESFSAIKQAVVVARKQGDQYYLIAYYVSKEMYAETDIIKHISNQLPDYMLPNIYVHLSFFPVTATGKLDREALPNVELGANQLIVGPVTELERKLVDIYSAILGLSIKQISIETDFLRLGGNSLLAIKLVNEINKKCNVKLNILSLLKNTSIKQLCKLIADHHPDQDAVTKIQFASDSFQKLSYAQEGLWFIEQLKSGNAGNNIALEYVVKSGIDITRLRLSLINTVNKHEILHSMIREDRDGNIYQQAIDFNKNPLHIQEERVEDDEELEFLLKNNRRNKFDLTRDYPIKIFLIHVKVRNCYILNVIVHHIAFDGWSTDIFLDDVIHYYQDNCSQLIMSVNDQSLQYKDFALWQRGYLTDEKLEKYLNYWKNQLDGYVPLNLVFDKVRPQYFDHTGADIHFELPENISVELRKLAKFYGVSLYSVLLVGFSLMLKIFSGQDDIILGTLFANRHYHNVDKMIGFFVNLLALRVKIDNGRDVISLITAVNEHVIEAQIHQELPFEKLIHALNLAADTSRHPLFQVLFTVQSFGNNTSEIFNRHESSFVSTDAKFDLGMYLDDSKEILHGRLNYATSLFEQKTMQLYVDKFCLLLGHMVKAFVERQIDSAPVYTLCAINKNEFDLVVTHWNKTDNYHPRNMCLHVLFEQQVLKTPDNIAVQFKNKSLKFKELNEIANQFAMYIKQEFQFNKNKLIGLCVDRSERVIVCMLAILKAGHAFLPMDSALPSTRINKILTAANSSLLIVDSASVNKFTDIDFINIDDPEFQVNCQKYSKGNLDEAITIDSLAYVISTSGTSGVAKGVMISHRAIVSRLWYFIDSCQLNENSNILGKTSLTFDASFREVFTSLLTGAKLYLLDEIERKSADNLISAIEKYKITYCLFVPSQLRYFVAHIKEHGITAQRLQSIQYLTTSGEVLRRDDVDSVFEVMPNVIMKNQFGSTECCMIQTECTIRNDDSCVINIGRPIANVRAYVLDKFHQPLGIGGVGELYFSSISLAEGYINDAERTHSRFISNYFQTELDKEQGIHDRLYNTGDIVRWLSDGSLQYLGRNDNQIKIRGFRVELAEVEIAIKQYPGISECVVLVNKKNNEDYLVAYYVADCVVNYPDVVKLISEILPDYMIPASSLQIEKIPITVNGKLDVKALPEIVLGSDIEYVAPKTNVEIELVELWADILSIPKTGIGVLHDFFSLGGNSLIAIKLIGRINHRFNTALSVVKIFTHKTIRKIAIEICADEEKKFSITPVKSVNIEEQCLSHEQEGLWFIAQDRNTMAAYTIAFTYELVACVDLQCLKLSIQALVESQDVLHTLIKIKNQGTPYQEVVDLIVKSVMVDEQLVNNIFELQDKFDIEIQRGFNLSEEFPIRFVIFTDQVSHKRYLSVIAHHIAFDGWSVDILVQGLDAAYCYLTKNKGKNLSKVILPKLDIQYKDFAHWQRHALDIDRESHKEYWLRQLENISPVDLLTDFNRPQIFDYSGANVIFTIDNEVSAKIKFIARYCRVTPYTILLAAYYLMLSAYSGQDDIVVGTTIANRDNEQLKDLIGYFISVAPIRVCINKNQTLYNYIKSIEKILIDAKIHSNYPFEQLVNDLNYPSDPSRHPLFQVLFSVQSFGCIPSSLFTGSNVSNHNNYAKFDLSLFIDDSQEAMSARFNYANSLFKQSTIENFVEVYQQVLWQFICLHQENKVETACVCHIELLSKSTLYDTLFLTNETEKHFLTPPTLHQLFEQQVVRSPNRIAIQCDGNQISYFELNNKANQLASYIAKHPAVSENKIIGLCFDRGILLLVHLLAVLKAGCAYVPIDPSTPMNRFNYILNDTKMGLLLTEAKYLDKFSKVESLCVEFIDIDHLSDHIVSANHDKQVSESDLAYIIYTSGSSGNPKGVMIEHRTVVNYVHNLQESIFRSSDPLNVDFSTNIAFDLSVSTTLGALLNGHKVCIFSKDNRDVESYINYCLSNNIHVIKQVPSYFECVVDALMVDVAKKLDLTHLILGGEKLSPILMSKIFKKLNLCIFDEYGPTEATVGTHVFSIKNPLQLNEHCMGKLYRNYTQYVLDNSLRPVPIGAVGELHIGGTCLARGYLNQPMLNKQKFIKNPFQSPEDKKVNRNSIIYKTGDQVRQLEEGRLIYVCRNDFQVKINGYRIELADIEGLVAEMAGIKRCIVVPFDDHGVNFKDPTRLLAYYTSFEKINNDLFEEELGRYLPRYMLPELFVHLENIPLTGNGKIDYEKLPKQFIATQSVLVEPGCDLERAMLLIWQDILKHEANKLSVEDDFFTLGGNSILLIKLLVATNKGLGANLTISDLFSNTTVRKICKRIKAMSVIMEGEIN